MIKNWLKEIVEEFKRLPIEQRIDELNNVDEHEIIRVVSLIQDNLEESITPSEYVFKLSSMAHGDLISSINELQYSIVLCINAANDERFALAA